MPTGTEATPAVKPPVIPLDHTMDYLTWLRFANAGHFQHGNIAAMDHAIERMPGEFPILEVGSFAGLSANQITALKRRHGRTNPLFTCDPWVFESLDMNVKVGAHHVTFKQYADFIRDTYVRNVKFFSSDAPPISVRMFSDDFFRAWRAKEEVVDLVSGGMARLGGPIGFCFLDGSHEHGSVLRDFMNADELLVGGGFVLFNDSGDAAAGPGGKPWGSRKVAKEVEASRRYELVSKDPNYLFRKR